MYLCRATEQARLIVRECGEQLCQAAATVPASQGLATPQEGGGASDEKMETSSSTAKVFSFCSALLYMYLRTHSCVPCCAVINVL